MERWSDGAAEVCTLIANTINNVALLVILVISHSLVIVHVNQRATSLPAKATATTTTIAIKTANMFDLVVVGICRTRTTRVLHLLPLYTDTTDCRCVTSTPGPAWLPCKLHC